MQLPLEDFLRLGVALLLGLLIGLDRERAEVRKHTHLFAGVRTFPLIALAAAVPALRIDLWGVVPLVASLLTVAALLLVAYLRSTAEGRVGATTEMAALVTFLLGALAGSGELLLAAGIGIAVALLLNAKPRLEGFSRALSQHEIDAALELGVISCIVLPLLPNTAMGPWQAWNPFEIWLVVVAVSMLSFAGFVAMRWFGEGRGLLISGLIGALVSSTAVTAAMAVRSRERPAVARLAAGAAILASTVMGWRVLILVAGAGGALVPGLLPLILAMTAVGLVASGGLTRGGARHPEPDGSAAIENPFSLKQAVTFGLIYALVLVITPAAREYVGTAGIYVAAGLSSLVDVDAVAIAFARGTDPSLTAREASTAVSIALIVNTLVKLGIALAIGERDFRIRVAAGLGAMALVGSAIAVLFLRLA